MNLKVKLKYKKSTKGTFVFGNDDESAPIPTLYIKRSAISGDTVPKVIILTIEGSNDE